MIMTIADDMRAASMGELARTKAQLKSANDEIQQLRRELDQYDQRAAADLDVLSATQYELDRMTSSRDTWKRIALAYRCDRNEVFGSLHLFRYISGWSIARRMVRRAEEMSA